MERPTVLKRFLRKPAFTDQGLALYGAIVAQGRLPVFYSDLSVPDSVDGRFDLITLHIFLGLRRLKREGETSSALAQDLSEIFFADMDLNLRELGASDIGVGRRVKRMIEGYYGRAMAYEAALDGQGDDLNQVLARNLYGTTEVGEAVLADLAAYVRAADVSLQQQSWVELSQGLIKFPQPRLGMAEHVG